MLYTLHELSGTSTHVISQRASRKDVAALVAEIVVGMDGGFTLLRMDETGVLADRLPSALSAYSFYVLWTRYLNPTIVPVPMW